MTTTFLIESIPNMKLLLVLLAAAGVWAADDFTLYELLPPSTHSFDITYDVTQAREGRGLLLQPDSPRLDRVERARGRSRQR